MLGTHTFVRGTWGAIAGTCAQDASAHDASPQGAARLSWWCAYPVHPSSSRRFTLPRLVEQRQRAGALLLAPAAAQPPVLRPVPTTRCTSCGWRLLDGSGTWWRKCCDSGGRRGREPAPAWERPPPSVPPSCDTQGGIHSQPGIGLPATQLVCGCPRREIGRASCRERV